MQVHTTSYGSDIARHPAPLLIYDGDCSFCTASAKWVAARWRGNAQAVPWQTLAPDELAEHGLTEDDVRCAAWWIAEDGRTFRGHLAIAQALKACSGWLGPVGHVLLVPPFLWIGAAVYPLMGRWRHFLPGGTPACKK
jgi:predicted DCC family thiol-disulfide oxidoreductase YuxK